MILNHKRGGIAIFLFLNMIHSSQKKKCGKSKECDLSDTRMTKCCDFGILGGNFLGGHTDHGLTLKFGMSNG